MESVIAIYRRAKGTAWHNRSETKRCQARAKYEKQIMVLAGPYLNDREAPQHILAKRIERFLSELFTWVRHPEAPSDNNAAERALRPVVIYRKVSGGTRSNKGSKTTSILLSLLSTWQLRGLDPIETCVAMLTNPQSLPRASPA